RTPQACEIGVRPPSPREIDPYFDLRELSWRVLADHDLSPRVLAQSTNIVFARLGCFGDHDVRLHGTRGPNLPAFATNVLLGAVRKVSELSDPSERSAS